MKVNTELCVDLKTKLQNEVLMKPGKLYQGFLTHDIPCEDYGYDEDHYTFIEALPSTSAKRNQHVFTGKYININRKDDGTLYPTFNRPRFSKKFTFQDFCREAADELRTIAWCIDIQSSGLIEEMDFAE